MSSGASGPEPLGRKNLGKKPQPGARPSHGSLRSPFDFFETLALLASRHASRPVNRSRARGALADASLRRPPMLGRNTDQGRRIAEGLRLVARISGLRPTTVEGPLRWGAGTRTPRLTRPQVGLHVGPRDAVRADRSVDRRGGLRLRRTAARRSVRPRTNRGRGVVQAVGVGGRQNRHRRPPTVRRRPRSPFAPVRDGAVDELVAGMGLAADLGTETVSSISRRTPGTPAGPGPRRWRSVPRTATPSPRAGATSSRCSEFDTWRTKGSGPCSRWLIRPGGFWKTSLY